MKGLLKNNMRKINLIKSLTNIKQIFKRFKRKHYQIVNLFITSVFFIIICFVIMFYQTYLSNIQRLENKKVSEDLYNDILARQDSLFNEIEHLKIGISDATQRTYKVTRAANVIKEIRHISEIEAIKLASLLYDESERVGIDFSYVLAIVHTESHFNNKAISNVGAQGIMQIMPMTFISVAKIYGYDYLETDITDLKKNIRIGTLFLHRLKLKLGSYDLVSVAYNGGPKVVANYKKLMAGDITAFVPEETQNYVVTVNSYRKYYRKILGE